MQTTNLSFRSQIKEKRLGFDVKHILWSLKVVVMEHKKSIVYCGAEEDDVAALRAHDESFYGYAPVPGDSESEFRSSSSSDSDSSSDESPAKLVDYSTDNCDDEYFSYEEDFATGCSSNLRGEAADGVSEGFFHATVRDNRRLGCGCANTHWQQLARK